MATTTCSSTVQPRLGNVTQSADVAVVPIQPGPFDFWAVAETLESLD